MSESVDPTDFTPEGIKRIITANGDLLDEWHAERGLTTERMEMKARIAFLESQNAELRAKLEEALRVIEPFVAAFNKRRDHYARRYKDRSLGYANFDKMPDRWPMEAITFTMGQFRAAARFDRGTETE